MFNIVNDGWNEINLSTVKIFYFMYTYSSPPKFTTNYLNSKITFYYGYYFFLGMVFFFYVYLEKYVLE